MTLPKVGELAPKFNLLNQDGKSIKLSDFKGKKNIVLYFYPKALTPGCTVQACAIRDYKKDFAQANTIVFGVSADPLEKLNKFIEKHKLNFDLLSDEDKSTCKDYDVWGKKKFMGREYLGIKRMTFIIDIDGKLRHIMEAVKTKTHHKDVLDWINSSL
jgi:peroxiredoxin Q/BCP